MNFFVTGHVYSPFKVKHPNLYEQYPLEPQNRIVSAYAAFIFGFLFRICYFYASFASLSFIRTTMGVYSNQTTLIKRTLSPKFFRKFTQKLKLKSFH